MIFFFFLYLIFVGCGEGDIGFLYMIFIDCDIGFVYMIFVGCGEGDVCFLYMIFVVCVGDTGFFFLPKCLHLFFLQRH